MRILRHYNDIGLLAPAGMRGSGQARRPAIYRPGR
ncbi:hypothetical protein [Nocardia otitidiscaviarum]